MVKLGLANDTMAARIMSDIRGGLPALSDLPDPYRTTFDDLATSLSAIVTPTPVRREPVGVRDVIHLLGSAAWQIRDLGRIGPEDWADLYRAAINVLNAAEHLRGCNIARPNGVKREPTRPASVV